MYTAVVSISKIQLPPGDKKRQSGVEAEFIVSPVPRASCRSTVSDVGGVFFVNIIEKKILGVVR